MCGPAGRMEKAAELLGAPYGVLGSVVHGKSLGKSLGAPTVNLLPPKDKLLPPKGVYFSCVRMEGGRYPGITNIGCKPTVKSDGEINIETFLYDFSDTIYGREITVELLSFRRPERRFASVEALRAQIAEDTEAGRAFFADTRGREA